MPDPTLEAALSPGLRGFRVSPGLVSATRPGRFSGAAKVIGIFLGWILICCAWEVFGYLAPGFDYGLRYPLATRMKFYVVSGIMMALVALAAG